MRILITHIFYDGADLFRFIAPDTTGYLVVEQIMICNIPKQSVQYFQKGEDAQGFTPGDFLLVAGTSRLSKLIAFGQKMRFPKSRFTKWSHAALITGFEGQLIEATAGGIVNANINKYTGQDYFLVRIEADNPDRAQAVNFARSCLGDGYGILTFLSIGLSLLTGSKFSFMLEGQEVCSGLVARSLERTSAIFPTDASHISPCQLSSYYLDHSLV